MDKSGVQKWIGRTNLPLLLWAALLVVYGTVLVASATSGMEAGPGMVKRHLVGLAIGLVPMALAWLIDYKGLQHWVGPLTFGLAALILSPRIPGLGASAKGATAWLAIGNIRLFQPSEPAKLLFIVVMAAVIARYKGKIESGGDVLRILGYLALPLGLILLQPDLGTGMVFVAITMAMLLIGGMRAKWFLILGVVATVLVGTVFALDSTLDKVAGKDVAMKKYQWDRLLVFVDPGRDPDGAGYNLAQSKIAIGSGGLTGKGLQSGTQGNLNFLPERHTDFIFSVLGEELGFIGVVILLGLYLALLVTALEISASSRDLYGALIATGLIGMWTFQILVNAGMAVGIMPITGIPLPFMSFGSSFMVTNLAGTGMLLSVWSRRYGV